MRTTILALGVCFATATALAAGCNREMTSTPPAEPTEGAMNLQTGDFDAVAERLAFARCLRENTCDHVGNGRPYGTKAECMGVMRTATKRELAAAPDCHDKFDGVALDQCTAQIRELRCADSLDTVAELDTCRTDRLCK